VHGPICTGNSTSPTTSLLLPSKALPPWYWDVNESHRLEICSGWILALHSMMNHYQLILMI